MYAFHVPFRTIARSAFSTLVAIAAPLLLGGPPAADAAALTSVSWTVSNTQTGATGTTYAFSFRTATAGSIKSITMTVPAGTSGTPTIVRNFGVGAGTVALASNTITYTVTSAVNIAAGIPIYLEFSGLTNTSTVGAATSNVTTRNATPATIDGPTASNSVNFSSGVVTTTVAIARSTVFSIDVSDFLLALDPSVISSATQTINMGVSSNARLGYSLNCRIDQQPTGSGVSLGAFTSGMAGATAWSSGGPGLFGYAMSAINNGASGSPTPGGALSASSFAGFTTSGENCGGATGKTGNPLGSDLSGCGVGLCASAAHNWRTIIKAAADYTTEAGVYTATITYTVSPSY